MHPALLLRYLRLPLHIVPLLLIAIFSVLLTIAEHAGMFGIPVLLIVGSWFFKYAFVFLDHVIDGQREPPVFSAEMANPVEQRPMGLFLLLLFFFWLTGALTPLVGDTVVTVLRVLLLALVPAMVAAMSITGRFVAALNPLTVIGIVLRIPWAYCALLMAIGVLWFMPMWALRVLGDSLSVLLRKESLLPWHMLSEVGLHGFAIGVLATTLFMYLWLAMFVCIGGTIYERRKELKIESAAAPERKAARVNAELERERDTTMDRIFAELRGGALGNAGDTVRKLIEQAPNSLDECRWLYARAATASSQGLANYLAQLALPRLLAARATGEALKWVRERLLISDDFRPLASGQLLQLVQLARDAGDRATARRLLVDFDRHYPSDALISVATQLQAELER